MKAVPLYLILHVAEIQEVALVEPRIFNVTLDGGNYWRSAVQPLAAAESILYSSTSLWWSQINTTSTELCVAFQAETNSTLGPLINAIELYNLSPNTPPFTNDSDSTCPFNDLSLHS